MSIKTKFWISIALIISIINYIFSDSSKTTIYQGKIKTLILIDDLHYLDTHSMFWDQLRKMNFEIDFKMVDDPNIKLTYFGEYLYNNIIFFAPSFNEGKLFYFL